MWKNTGGSWPPPHERGPIPAWRDKSERRHVTHGHWYVGNSYQFFWLNSFLLIKKNHENHKPWWNTPRTLTFFARRWKCQQRFVYYANYVQLSYLELVFTSNNSQCLVENVSSGLSMLIMYNYLIGNQYIAVIKKTPTTTTRPIKAVLRYFSDSNPSVTN